MRIRTISVMLSSSREFRQIMPKEVVSLPRSTPSRLVLREADIEAGCASPKQCYLNVMIHATAKKIFNFNGVCFLCAC